MLRLRYHPLSIFVYAFGINNELNWSHRSTTSSACSYGIRVNTSPVFPVIDAAGVDGQQMGSLALFGHGVTSPSP